MTDNIQPKILIDIVMSNYWDPVACAMRCDQNKNFNVLMNGTNPLVYNRNPVKNVNERPRIKKPGSDKRKYLEDLHFLLTSQGNLQIFTNNMSCLLSTKMQLNQQGSDVE